MWIDGWELGEAIGKGGSGTVYRARGRDGSLVALKLMPRLEGVARARFDRERRLHASLGEGFVPLLATGECPLGLYIVMPLLTGGTLRDRLARGPLDLEEALALVRSLAWTLGRAHAHGVVHRDVKPENVLFDARGRPLIADMGVAKHFDAGKPGASQSVALSQSGSFCGTVAYGAPEQFGGSDRVDARADVFALGAVLYECLAGLPPFRGETMLEVLARVAKGDREPLRRLRPEVPAWLAGVVDRALARDPSARFQDGMAFAHALDEPPSRSRAPWMAAGAAVFVAGVVVFATFQRRAQQPVTAPPPPAAPPAPPVSRPPPPPAAAPPPPAAARSEIDEVIARSTNLAKQGRASEAVALLDQAIAARPDCADLWCTRGVIRQNSGDFAGGRSDTEKALELDPRHALSWRNLGAMRMAQGERREALEAYERAQAIDPESADGWAQLGLARQTVGDADGAISDYTRAVLGDRRLGWAWCNRGILRAQRGDHDGALADFEQAVALCPDDALGWCNRGIARKQRGDATGALADLNRAVELDPACAVAYPHRGDLHEAAGRRGEAIRDYERFLELLPPTDPRGSVVREWLATHPPRDF